MSFRRPRRIEVRHRGVAHGVIKVACGKGGAFYAMCPGLTKRKSHLCQRLERKKRAKRATFAKYLIGRLTTRGSRTGRCGGALALCHVDGDVQLLEFGAFVVREIALGHELVVPADGGF